MHQLICKRLSTPLFTLESLNPIKGPPSLVAVPFTLRCFISSSLNEVASAEDHGPDYVHHGVDDRAITSQCALDGYDTDAEETSSRKSASDSDTAYSSGE